MSACGFAHLRHRGFAVFLKSGSFIVARFFFKNTFPSIFFKGFVRMPFQMHSVAAFDDAKLVFFFEKHVRMLAYMRCNYIKKIAKFREYSA